MRAIVALVVSIPLMLCGNVAPASASEAVPAAAGSPAIRLYAVEYRTGPAWDASKPPSEQRHFAGHSANLRRLREAGSLRLGARYGDKGLVVIEAASLDAARQLVEADPSIAAGTFVYELHALSVFYEGALTRPAAAR